MGGWVGVLLGVRSACDGEGRLLQSGSCSLAALGCWRRAPSPALPPSSPPVPLQVQRPGVEPIIYRDLFIFRWIGSFLSPLSKRHLGCNAELIVDEFGEGAGRGGGGGGGGDGGTVGWWLCPPGVRCGARRRQAASCCDLGSARAARANPCPSLSSWVAPAPCLPACGLVT